MVNTTALMHGDLYEVFAVICMFLVILAAASIVVLLIARSYYLQDHALSLEHGTASTATPSEPVPSTESSSPPRLTVRGRATKPMIRIVRCRDPQMWYAKLIGQEVELLGTWPEGYVSRETAGYLNVVRFDDAEIIPMEK